MREEEVERVKRQKEEVEELIQKEVDTRKWTSEATNTNGEEDHGQRQAGANGTSEQSLERKVTDVDMEEPCADGAGSLGHEHKSPSAHDNGPEATNSPAPEAVLLDDKAKDDDHGGDELLEGHDEDQVIY